MNQLYENSFVNFDNVERLLISIDTSIGMSNFIFFQSNADWYQVYVDFNVVFIDKINDFDDFFNYIKDMDLKIVTDLMLERLENMKLEYICDESILLLTSHSLNLFIDIENDFFKKVRLEHTRSLFIR